MTKNDERYYCPDCGRIQHLPDGAVYCNACSALGLRGFSRPPRRVQCDQAGCAWAGWDDGINPDRVDHMRRDHHLPQPCEPCKGNGQRRSKAKAAVNGKAPCNWCGGAGQR